MVFPLGGFEFQAHTFGISAGENDAVRVANVIALANNDVSVCVNLSRVHGLSLDVYMLSAIARVFVLQLCVAHRGKLFFRAIYKNALPDLESWRVALLS